MHFLELVGHELCCAPRFATVGPGPSLRCGACGNVPVPDLYAYVEQPFPGDYFRSGLLAAALADWLGSAEGVRVSFPVSHVEGILDRVVRGQSLVRVRKSVRLLRALNAPFTRDAQPVPALGPDVEGFLAEFLEVVRDPQQPVVFEGGEEDRVILETLMSNMHGFVKGSDELAPFRIYFDVLVPYVLAVGQWTPLQVGPEDPNPASELHAQLVRSHLIRSRLSKYVVPFDVLHVMVCCYACSSDLDVMGNWALDFVARLFRGEFYWKRYVDSPFVVRMLRLIHTQVTYYRKTPLYNAVVKPIVRGESIDHYSGMWIPYHELQHLLKQRYSVPGAPSGDVLDLAFGQLFPAVLFSDHADQLAFTLGYYHLANNVPKPSRNNVPVFLPSGAFKKARAIHDVVRRLIRCVEDFDGDDSTRDGDRRLVWNLDTVKLFFASDPRFHDEIKKVIQILTGKEEE